MLGRWMKINELGALYMWISDSPDNTALYWKPIPADKEKIYTIRLFCIVGFQEQIALTTSKENTVSKEHATYF